MKIEANSIKSTENRCSQIIGARNLSHQIGQVGLTVH